MVTLTGVVLTLVVILTVCSALVVIKENEFSFAVRFAVQDKLPVICAGMVLSIWVVDRTLDWVLEIEPPLLLSLIMMVSAIAAAVLFTLLCYQEITDVD